MYSTRIFGEFVDPQSGCTVRIKYRGDIGLRNGGRQSGMMVAMAPMDVTARNARRKKMGFRLEREKGRRRPQASFLLIGSGGGLIFHIGGVLIFGISFPAQNACFIKKI